MLESLLRDAAIIIGFFHVVGPVAVRSTFRFATRCKPTPLSLEELPGAVSSRILPRVPEMQALGFETVGYYDCGEMARHTRSYVAYFVNRKCNDFASVSVAMSPNKVASYLEFSTRLSNGFVLDTNTNSILPLTPANSEGRVFRFPKIEQPKTLYEVHHQLLAKYAGGFEAQGEPKGREIERLVRIVENYGVRHSRIGYMYLDPQTNRYRLTWKGAVLMTWRALWPTKFFRSALHTQNMRNELRSLQIAGAIALQKA